MVDQKKNYRYICEQDNLIKCGLIKSIVLPHSPLHPYLFNCLDDGYLSFPF